MNRICIYTCITGDYDDLKNVEKQEGIDYICFTNNHNISSDSWQIIYIDDEDNIGNIALARKTKIILNDYIKNNYDVSVWVDGAVVIRGSIKEFLESTCDLENHDMVVFNHSVRSSVYDEAAAIIKYRKESLENIQRTVDFLKKEMFPENFGLTETTILIRKSNSKIVDDVMNLWFELLMKYSTRDQLSFDYSIYKLNANIQRLDLNVFDNKWFGWIKHNKKFGFDVCRVYFDDYVDIYESKLLDVFIKKDDVYKISFEVIKNCSYIELHMGQLMGYRLANLNISSNNVVEVATNCCIAIDDYFIMGNDPLIIRLIGNFETKDKIEVDFDLIKILDEEWANIFIKLSKDFERLLVQKNNEIEILQTNYDSLKNRKIVKFVDKLKR